MCLLLWHTEKHARDDCVVALVLLGSDKEDASLQDALEGGNERFDCPHCGVEILSDVEKQRHLVCECPVLYNKDVRYTCELCKMKSIK